MLMNSSKPQCLPKQMFAWTMFCVKPAKLWVWISLKVWILLNLLPLPHVVSFLRFLLIYMRIVYLVLTSYFYTWEWCTRSQFSISTLGNCVLGLDFPFLHMEMVYSALTFHFYTWEWCFQSRFSISTHETGVLDPEFLFLHMKMVYWVQSFYFYTWE